MSEPELHLPGHIHRLADKESFTFACHPGVPCFTECCRELELILSPYDVLRLSRQLAMSGKEFVDRYAVIEWQEEDVFPRVYLGMIDDGRASCPFVTAQGCAVYPGRPAACRTYPLGRGAWRDSSGGQQALYVLQREPHCQGFAEPAEQSVELWVTGQGLIDYLAANDMMIPLLQHEKIRRNFQSTVAQRELYLNTLYDLEKFRDDNENLRELTDLQLLQSAVSRLIHLFFEDGVHPHD